MTQSTIPLNIVAAEPKDVPTILSMIHELAEFERLTHMLTATEEQLHEHLFGSKPYAEVLLAFVGHQPVGFALFFHNYSTFLARPGIYFEDLYVREAWRSQGIGTALFLNVKQRAEQRSCGRFEWSVLNWNQRAIAFYENMGAKPLNEWTVYRMTITLDESENEVGQ